MGGAEIFAPSMVDGCVLTDDAGVDVNSAGIEKDCHITRSDASVFAGAEQLEPFCPAVEDLVRLVVEGGHQIGCSFSWDAAVVDIVQDPPDETRAIPSRRRFSSPDIGCSQIPFNLGFGAFPV